MKKHIIKMITLLIVSVGLFIDYKVNNKPRILESIKVESLALNNNLSYRELDEGEQIVYENLSLNELSKKIDKVLNSTLNGYGETISKLALDAGVDPVVASSIILVETGCYWTCSGLVKYSNNVGGMRSRGGYMKFSSLDAGLRAFINNLANNYYAYGLNTPELINKKYAENPNWYKNVNYYINLIKAN